MIIRTALIALSVLSPLAAQAQTTQAAAPGSAVVTPSMDRVERHITDLKQRLQITPAQQPQWDAFTGVMRQNAQHMATLYSDRAAHATILTAPEDMRTYAELARAHADDLQKLVPAFDALYAAMTPEQKANADKVFQRFQGRSERRGRAVRP